MKTSFKKYLTRRHLLNWGSFSLLSTLMLACANSTSDTPGASTPATQGGNCSGNGATVTIESNHGHSASAIANTDVNTGSQAIYNLTGGTHSHTFTVTASQFTSLQANTGVTLTSDADGTGHTHSLTINCIS